MVASLPLQPEWARSMAALLAAAQPVSAVRSQKCCEERQASLEGRPVNPGYQTKCWTRSSRREQRGCRGCSGGMILNQPRHPQSLYVQWNSLGTAGRRWKCPRGCWPWMCWAWFSGFCWLIGRCSTPQNRQVLDWEPLRWLCRSLFRNRHRFRSTV